MSSFQGAHCCWQTEFDSRPQRKELNDWVGDWSQTIWWCGVYADVESSLDESCKILQAFQTFSYCSRIVEEK